MRALFVAAVAVVLCGCPGGGSSDGGTGGGGGDGGTGGGSGGGAVVDAGPLPRNFDAEGLTVLLQNGKVVAGGRGGQTDEATPKAPDFFLMRTSTVIAPDPTFGGGRGFVLNDFDGGVSGITFNSDAIFGAMADGDKVVAVGYARAPAGVSRGNAAIARYNADGSLDTTFNTRGSAMFDFNETSPSTNLAAAFSIGKRADGKYMMAGTVENDTVQGPDMFVFRLGSDGVLDNTFSTTLPINFGGNEGGYDLVIQGNKTVVGGGTNFAICRLTDTGALDPTFATMGKFTSTGGTMLMMLARPDGKLLAIGLRSVGAVGSEHAALKLVQLTADGALDTAFGTMGVKEIDDGGDGSGPSGDLRGAAFLPDGSLMLFSEDILGSRLFKLKPDGSVDTAWGTNGQKPTGFNVGILGFLTSMPRGSHALTVDATNAYVTGTNLVELKPGQPETVFDVKVVPL